MVGAKVLGCLLGGDSLLGRTWMEVCRVGRNVIREIFLRTCTAVGSYGTAFVVG